MTEAKHTPGPWVVCIQDDDDKAFEIFSESQLVNGRISAEKWDDALARAGLNHKEFEANARLIAAAPELLEALNAALATIDDYLDYEHNGDPWVEDARAMGEMDINDYKRDGRLEKARAAIAKATGQPHD